MQAISKCELEAQNYPIDITFSDNEISDDFRVVEFMEKTENGEIVITLCSAFFLKGSVRLEMRNRKLKVIVSEFVETRKKSWVPVNDWEQYTRNTYTRIHNMRIMLPEDDFCILRQMIIREKSYLKVVLSKTAAA